MTTKKDTFEQLIDDNLMMFRRTAVRILGSSEDADDAVQEALLTAWRKFDSFRRDASPVTWVMRILINTCYDVLRKRKSERISLSEMPLPDAHGDDAQARLISRLEFAIAELPDIYRESLTLGVLSHRSADDAAALLGCSRNTLYQRIHKAKQLLKIALTSQEAAS